MAHCKLTDTFIRINKMCSPSCLLSFVLPGSEEVSESFILTLIKSSGPQASLLENHGAVAHPPCSESTRAAMQGPRPVSPEQVSQNVS